jgi:hypothetical protein
MTSLRNTVVSSAPQAREASFDKNFPTVIFRQPVVAFTGVSLFGVDLQQAKLTAHYDYWDNLKGKEVRTGQLYKRSACSRGNDHFHRNTKNTNMKSRKYHRDSLCFRETGQNTRKYKSCHCKRTLGTRRVAPAFLVGRTLEWIQRRRVLRRGFASKGVVCEYLTLNPWPHASGKK